MSLIENLLNFLKIYSNALGKDNLAETLDFINIELTFINIDLLFTFSNIF